MDRHDPRTLRRARRLARAAGALVGLLGGVFYGLYIISGNGWALSGSRLAAVIALAASGLVGLLAGVFAGPLLSVEPYLWLERTLDEVSGGDLLGGAMGLIVGLVVAALVAVLLGGIPYGIGIILSLALAAALVSIGVRTGMRRQGDLFAAAGELTRRGRSPDRAGAEPGGDGPTPLDGPPIVVDTSVLIDGRVLDVARTGFIQGRLIIAGFVLEELQRVADAGDPVRRAKGRRGLDAVGELKESSDVVCDVVDVDFPGTPEVDARLVKLARLRQASLMTTDFNLNRLARVEGIRVLNVNELANAVKPILTAGETLELTVIKEGKEPQQGVAYLPDGTMVVIENGRRHIDESVVATVTSVLQTPAGRMIFAVLPVDEPRGRPVRARPPRASSR